jgi:hypothetical protein
MSQYQSLMAPFAAALVSLAATAVAAQDAAQPKSAEMKSQKIYELRIYVTNPGKLPELHARFRDHTMKLFEKHGMENVIYWTLAEDVSYRTAGGETRAEPKDDTLVYILAHKSKEAADESWRNFRADPDWQAVVTKTEANGRLTASPPVSVFMNPTDFHPGEWDSNAKSDKPARLFELRTYNDGEARVPSTVGRFRDWEAQLFRDSGIETLGFWTKADNSAFVYLLGHKDRETADANWQKFFTAFRGRGRNSNPDPPNPQVQEQGGTPQGVEQSAKQGGETRGGEARSGRQGRRGGRGGGIERRWLIPTDYSPRK